MFIPVGDLLAEGSIDGVSLLGWTAPLSILDGRHDPKGLDKLSIEE